PAETGVVVVAGAPQPAPAGEAPLGAQVIDAPAGPASEHPIDLTAGALPPAAPPAIVASLGDPNADYERAYGSILSGDYEQAEAEFRGFLQAFPGDARSPDAQYWLGESLFARGQYREAADEFLAGYKAYPKSGKAPDTLLKLGLSLAGLGEREAACSTYAEVLKRYPQASKALRQRVSTEQAVASC
ncbi:MAG TPA: tol-pal system protein YbgF, partial [Bauldia sp.]|nr:tol-pal system protein YbgF [Bauldia sp.]